MGLYLKFLSYPLPKKVESPFLSMSSPVLCDLWSRCERQHGEQRGRRLFWVSLGGNALESSIAAAAPQTVMDRRRQASLAGRATKKATTKKATKTGKGRYSQWRGRSVDVAYGFIAVEFDFRICVPLRFCLRYRRLRRSLLTQGKKVEENDADSWRHGSLHAVDERAQRHIRRGTKDAHVASLDEGLARELRGHTRCCTRVQCQGRGRGLKKSNTDCARRSINVFTTKWLEGR